jgi:small subunit ribosomal protein S6
MKTYELVVLFHPDLEIDIDTPISKVEKLAEAAKAKVIKRDNWGKKRLAYRVKGQDFAVYVYFELQFEPAKVPGFEHNLLLAEEVMRHLLIAQELPSAKSEAKKAKATAKVAANKEDTDGKEL